MSTELKQVRNDFKIRIDKMLDRSNSFQGASARLYKLYQKFQTKRFQTENASEGNPWKPLNPDYKEYKTKRYGGGPKRNGDTWKSWPGNGTKMLIGTGTLAGAVIGPGSPFATAGVSAHHALFTKNSMQITIDTSGINAEGKPFNYASFVNEERPFMEFSDAHIDEMKDLLISFVVNG